jgi:hypothetical protein
MWNIEHLCVDQYYKRYIDLQKTSDELLTSREMKGRAHHHHMTIDYKDTNVHRKPMKVY